MKIGIRLYTTQHRYRQGIQFDLASIIMRMIDLFPNMNIEEEYFQKTIGFLNQFNSDRDNGQALKIAEKDAEERGPIYRFSVPSERGTPLKGTMGRYSLSFDFDDTCDDNLVFLAKEFLASFQLEVYNSEQ